MEADDGIGLGQGDVPSSETVTWSYGKCTLLGSLGGEEVVVQLVRYVDVRRVRRRQLTASVALGDSTIRVSNGQV